MKGPIPLSYLWLALGVSLACGGCDLLTSTSARLERADQALQEGKWDAALADAQAVVRNDPQHAGGWMLLARIGLIYGDGERALADVERALAAGAAESAALPLKAEALLQARRFEEILALPSDPGLVTARATALAALGRGEEATTLVREILARDPRHTDARLMDARLRAADGAGVDAAAAVDALLRDEPNNADASVLRARFAMASGDLATAVSALEQASANAGQMPLPERIGIQAALIESALANGQVDKASSALARMRELAPKSPATEFLSARVLIAQGDSGTAVSVLQRLLADDPSMAQARLVLAAAFMEQGTFEQARGQLEKLIAEQPGNLAARRLMAELLASQGDPRAAERMLADLPEGSQPDSVTQWMRSSLLSALGEPAEALAVLELAAAAEPGNLRLQVELAEAYIGAGRQDLARELLDSIPAQGGDWASKHLLVLQRIAGESGSSVKGALLALSKENAADALLRTIVGQALLRLGEAAAAATEYRAALAASPRLVQAQLGLAGTLMMQGDLPAAEREFRNVLAVDPAVEPAYLGLAAIARQKRDTAAATRWLEQAIGVVPSAGSARLALAELHYGAGQDQSADALLAQVVRVAGDKATALQRVGAVQLQAGRPEKAAATLREALAKRPSGQNAIRVYMAEAAAGQPNALGVLQDWVKAHPDDLAVRAAMAAALLQRGQHAAAIAEYELVVTRQATPVNLNNLAWLYQRVGDPRAEATARLAHEGAPDNPQITDTYGWILLERGRPAEALPLLVKAAQALPDNAEVQAHLKQARQQAGSEKTE